MKLGQTLNAQNNKIINLPTPVDNADAATKEYVDLNTGSSTFNYPEGLFLDLTGITSGNLTNLTPPASDYRFFPFIPKANLRASSISIQVSSPGTTTVVVYCFQSNFTTGLPESQLFNASFSMGTTGTKTVTSVQIGSSGQIVSLSTYLFQKDTLYWWAYYTSQTTSGAVRANAVGNCYSLGLTSDTSTNHATHYRLTGSLNLAINTFDDIGSTPVLTTGSLPSILLNTTTV